MQAFKNKTILQILDKYKDLWALGYTSSIAHWDMETYMPNKGITARGEALGRISTIRQRLILDKSFTDLVSKAQKQKELTDQELAVIRILNRSLKFYKKMPPQFMEEFSRVTSEATMVWRSAKEKNDFKLFEKHLTKIFDL